MLWAARDPYGKQAIRALNDGWRATLPAAVGNRDDRHVILGHKSTVTPPRWFSIRRFRSWAAQAGVLRTFGRVTPKHRRPGLSEQSRTEHAIQTE